MGKVAKNIDIIHNSMLEILVYIDNLCKENKLPYFLDGGSWIGAIRHKGFIPWDDDIDISMLKCDYLKLIDIIQKDQNSKFGLYFNNHMHHCCNYIYLKSKYWQNNSNSILPSLYPIKLDVRPLNVIKNTTESLKENLLLRKTANYIIFKKFESEDLMQIQEKLSKYSSEKEFLLFYNTKYGLESINDSNVVLSHPYLEYSIENTFDKSLVFPHKRIDFDGVSSYIPVSDQMLRNIYGNYMELPADKDRNSYSKSVYKISENKIEIFSKLYIKSINNELGLLGKIIKKIMNIVYSKNID